MIVDYEFDNANLNGDKEAVIVPNVPTLVNKLSANETNNIRDKINEVVAFVNLSAPDNSVVDFLDLKLKMKGEQAGLPNALPTLQIGDVVHGFSSAGVVWSNAYYLGGDVTDRNNYEVVNDPIKKTDFLTHSVVETGANISIPIKANGASLYLLQPGVTSVKGFNLSEITGNPSAEVPFENKSIFVMNSSGADANLIHLDTIDVPFVFKSGVDVIIPNNEEMEFRYTSGGLGEVFRSWSDVVVPESDLYKSQQWIASSHENSGLMFSGILEINRFLQTGTRSFGSSPFNIANQNYLGTTEANSIVGLRNINNPDFIIRNGIDAYFVFGNNDINTSHQTMIGFNSAAPAFHNLSIENLMRSFYGVGNDDGDSNLSFYAKKVDGVVNYVKVPLTSDFPAHTTTDAFLLRMEMPRTEVVADVTLKLTLTNLTNKAVITHTFTYLEISSITSGMFLNCLRSNRNSGIAANLRFSKLHLTRKMY
jgi:hypothetical protein